MSTSITQRLCKWRNLFNMMATLGDRFALERYVRDNADRTLLLRAEVNAITALLIQKGVFTPLEFTAQLDVEAEELMHALEKIYPGFMAGDDGLSMQMPQAQQTIESWKKPWGTGK